MAPFFHVEFTWAHGIHKLHVTSDLEMDLAKVFNLWYMGETLYNNPLRMARSLVSYSSPDVLV